MRLSKPLLLLALLLTAAPCFAQVTAFTGRVVGITDGDTITVLAPGNRQVKVRLAGIDAPEKGQDFGKKAKQYLSRLVDDESVTVFGKKTDQFGRLVAQVFAEGKDVGYLMIQAGYAWHYREFTTEQTAGDRRKYAEEEQKARQARVNLWKDEKPLPPWEYRNGSDASDAAKSPTIEVVGNSSSMIYHWNPGCRDFFKIAPQNRVPFKSKEAAEAAGYRAAKKLQMIYEYLVMDERYHSVGLEANGFFATNDFAEAKLVANEVGFNSVVVRIHTETAEYDLIYDAALNTELPLAP